RSISSTCIRKSRSRRASPCCPQIGLRRCWPARGRRRLSRFMAGSAPLTARAKTDARDWLSEADEPLAGPQLRSGGELPGIIVSPALLELVRKARLYGLRLARAIRAQDDREQVTAWVEVEPAEGGGCLIGFSNWQTSPMPDGEGTDAIRRRMAIARDLAELSARLGPAQELLAVESDTDELQTLVAGMRIGLGRPWTDFVTLEGNVHEQPLHWRLLDGARLRVEGSARHWKAHLVPLGQADPGSDGFELYLVAEEPLEAALAAPPSGTSRPAFSSGVGREIAPVLR